MIANVKKKFLDSHAFTRPYYRSVSEWGAVTYSQFHTKSSKNGIFRAGSFSGHDILFFFHCLYLKKTDLSTVSTSRYWSFWNQASHWKPLNLQYGVNFLILVKGCCKLRNFWLRRPPTAVTDNTASSRSSFIDWHRVIVGASLFYEGLDSRLLFWLVLQW